MSNPKAPLVIYFEIEDDGYRAVIKHRDPEDPASDDFAAIEYHAGLDALGEDRWLDVDFPALVERYESNLDWTSVETGRIVTDFVRAVALGRREQVAPEPTEPPCCDYEGCDEDATWTAGAGAQFCRYHAADSAMADLPQSSRRVIASNYDIGNKG